MTIVQFLLNKILQEIAEIRVDTYLVQFLLKEILAQNWSRETLLVRIRHMAIRDLGTTDIQMEGLNFVYYMNQGM